MNGSGWFSAKHNINGHKRQSFSDILFKIKATWSKKVYRCEEKDIKLNKNEKNVYENSFI